jgi:hypothetical protein
MIVIGEADKFGNCSQEVSNVPIIECTPSVSRLQNILEILLRNDCESRGPHTECSNVLGEKSVTRVRKTVVLIDRPRRIPIGAL